MPVSTLSRLKISTTLMANAVFLSIRERDCGFAQQQSTNRTKGGCMNEQGTSSSRQPTEDSGNNEVGPTEKLREQDTPQGKLSVPGAQNPESAEIKEEKSPNSE